jgi:Ion channel
LIRFIILLIGRIADTLLYCVVFTTPRRSMSGQQNKESENDTDDRQMEYLQRLRTEATEHKGGYPSLRRYLEDDDQSRLFMSEPSLSTEGDRTGDSIHMSNLFSPHESSEEESITIPKASSPPPPSVQHLASMSSPGNTSISSRESPHFHNKVHMQFMQDKRSRLKIESTPYGPVLMSRPNPIMPDLSHRPQPSDNKKEYSDQLAPSSRSTSSVSLGQQMRAAEFLRDLKIQSIGALEDAGLNDYDSEPVTAPDRSEIDAVIRRQENIGDDTADDTIVMTLSDSDNDKDDDFDPLDWEQQNSADDEQTFERPRRMRRLLLNSSKVAASKTSPGHRRSRSGDGAAATLMTGGLDWKGMQEDKLHIPQSLDDDEEEDKGVHPLRKAYSFGAPSRTRNKLTRGLPGQPPSDGSPVFLMGTSATGAGQSPRKARKPPRQRRGISDRFDQQAASTSRSISAPRGQQFSSISTVAPMEIHQLQNRSQRLIPSTGNNSARFPVPFTSPMGVENGTFSHRMNASMSGSHASDSSNDSVSQIQQLDMIGDLSRSLPAFVGRHDFGGRYTRQFSDSSGSFDTMPSPGSTFSWISHARPSRPKSKQMSLEQELTEAKMPQMKGVHFHGNVQNEGDYSFCDGEDDGYYSQHDDNDNDAHEEGYTPINQMHASFRDADRLGPAEKNIEGFRVKTQRVDFAKAGNIPPSNGKPLPRKSPSGGKTIIDSDDKKFPTFACPRCGTVQRSFFTASTAPTQFEGPSSYLALYFAFYVVASLYIFGLEEGWKGLDCVYFAVITLTTTGLGDLVPTSDTAKIICSIFIYFGVACIGLLLGTYLAGMLDEKSYKEAMQSRVENCVECSQVKGARKLRTKRAVTPRGHPEALAVKFNANGIMSERHTCATDAHENMTQSAGEQTQKRRKHRHENSNQLGDTGSRDSEYFNSPASMQSLSSLPEASPTRETVPVRSPISGVNGFDVFAGEAPSPIHPTADPSSKSIGSPMTTQILGRQRRTRHQSFDVTNNSSFFSPPTKGWQADDDIFDSVPQGPIPENSAFHASFARSSPSVWNDDLHDHATAPHDDDSILSIDSERSEIDKSDSRIKTAKYVFLTLKQALMNSIVIIFVGGIGFVFIEKMTMVDSFYFTTALLTTVGYGDIAPVTDGGKLFATVYVLVAGTVLLNNMSLISMIPLELRRRRIEKAVLTQFGDQLDDAALEELATGPLIHRLNLSANNANGLNECTREMFSLAMLVRLGKVTERDVRHTFAAFKRLDVDSEGVLNSKTIISGKIKKHRSMKDLREGLSRSRSISPPPPLPSKPSTFYWFGKRGSLHEGDSRAFRFSNDRHASSGEELNQGEKAALLSGQNMNGHTFTWGTFAPQNHDEEKGLEF